MYVSVLGSCLGCLAATYASCLSVAAQLKLEIVVQDNTMATANLRFIRIVFGMTQGSASGTRLPVRILELSKDSEDNIRK